MESKKDFLGKELKVGDAVVFIDSDHKELKRGVITKLNAKQATILDPANAKKYEKWGADKIGYGKTCKHYTQIVKIEEGTSA